MKSIALITCGCSWAFGVGVGYQPGMSRDEFEKIKCDPEICDALSFRGILSRRYGADNFNFSQGGSSNQRQFRLLKNFLCSDEGHRVIDEYNQVIVLHGITTTARNELYLSNKDMLVNFKYYDTTKPSLHPYTKAYLNLFYNHENEVSRLAEEMQFLNTYYKALGIKNLWFDSFNHHDYPGVISGLIGQHTKPRDMSSVMALAHGFADVDYDHHMSSWQTDSPQFEFLISQGLLDPISSHPTKRGHEFIAEIIDQDLKNIIQLT